MPSIATLYNKLPTLEEADENFTERERVFSLFAVGLKGYEDEFGISLVHGHSQIKEDERMIIEGLVSRPRNDVKGYPERWLPTGEAYVFNTKPTESPPMELMQKLGPAFKAAGQINGVAVLAVSYLKNLPLARPGEIYMERTVGRDDIMELVPETPPGMIWTGWKAAPGGIVVKTHGCEAGYGGVHKVTIVRPHHHHHGESGGHGSDSD